MTLYLPCSKSEDPRVLVRGLADWLNLCGEAVLGYYVQRDRIFAYLRNAYSGSALADRDGRKPSANELREGAGSLLSELQTLAESIIKKVDGILPMVDGVHVHLAALPEPLCWETKLARTLYDLRHEIELDIAKFGDVTFSDVDEFRQEHRTLKGRLHNLLAIVAEKKTDLQSVALPVASEPHQKTQKEEIDDNKMYLEFYAECLAERERVLRTCKKKDSSIELESWQHLEVKYHTGSALIRVNAKGEELPEDYDGDDWYVRENLGKEITVEEAKALEQEGKEVLKSPSFKSVGVFKALRCMGTNLEYVLSSKGSELSNEDERIVHQFWTKYPLGEGNPTISVAREEYVPVLESAIRYFGRGLATDVQGFGVVVRSIISGLVPKTQVEYDRLREAFETSPFAKLSEIMRVSGMPEAKCDEHPEPKEETEVDNVFRRDGTLWLVRYAGGESFRLHQLKGLYYIWRLLRDQGKPIPAFNLVRKFNNITTKGRKCVTESEGYEIGFSEGQPGIDLLDETSYTKGGLLGAVKKLKEVKESATDPHEKAELQEQIEAAEERLRKGKNKKGDHRK